MGASDERPDGTAGDVRPDDGVSDERPDDGASAMRLALTELRRQPARFLVAMGILSVIAVLLMFLGGLLDGLLATSTGAYRAQRADLVVYSSGAEQSLVRSRIDREMRAEIAAVDGVEQVGGMSALQLGARRGDQPQSRDLFGVAIFGYESAPRGLPAYPPADGEVIADEVLKAEGVGEGDTVLVGPARTPLRVVGFVSDTQYAGQITLWSSMSTWRDTVAANRPDRTIQRGSAAALVVSISGSPGEVAGAIDQATGGATETMTLAAAIDALPGVSQQRTTFQQVIGITALVALLVVGLFFSLITVERLPLYGILKAIGASSATLFAGVVAQAVMIALAASAVGAVLAAVIDLLIPAGGLPFQIGWGRIGISVAVLVIAALVGSAFSLRRVLGVDPAMAIGEGG